MTWDRVDRLLGEDVLSFLRTQTVGIIGLGSGGSFVAVSLAMSGVGRFILVDDDSLEIANIVRHAADQRYVGQLKAEAVADLIHHRNPAADVKVVIGRIEDHTDVFDEVDLVISGVDGEGPKYLINQMCLEHGRKAIYAGVYERGEGGDVCVIVPGDGPCYACWAEHLREGLADAAPGAEPELDYGMIGPEGTLAAEPGLWLHVVRIAATQADLALKALVQPFDVDREMPGNTVILANTWLEIYEGQTTLPYGAEWLTIPRNPDCLVCGPLHRQQDSSQVSLDDLIGLGQVSYEQDESESS